jgi:hypothetical protein
MPGTKYLYDFLRDKEGIKKKDLTPEGFEVAICDLEISPYCLAPTI